MKKKYNEKTAIDIIDKVGARPEMLVQILHAFIKKFSYIDEQAIRLIAKKINFPQPTNKERILIKSLNNFNINEVKGTVNSY